LNNECTLKKIKDRNVKQGGKGEHENRGWRRVNMANILCILIEKANNETCGNCFKKGDWGMRENDGGGDSNQGVLWTHMLMSQWSPPYNYIC
jgi:hypothetical protein